MAGIAGMLGAGATQEAVDRMLDKLAHRGPDEQWSTSGQNWAMGVCTPALAATPARSHVSKEGLVVLLDGEIYNGAQTTSEVESMAAAYRQYGRTFAAHMHGAFAGAVYARGEIILVRDPIGIRPLYWGRATDGTLVFASEMKAMVGLVDEIHEMGPATVFSTQAGVQGYLPIHPFVPVPDGMEAAREALREALFRATERRLRDGAVGGMLLSGGLDSSIIAAIANQIKPGLPAFTVGVSGAPDVLNARVMAEHLGIEHHVREIGADEIRATIPRAVYTLESFDEDCVSGAIINLLASEWAGGWTNCILSGEGADELNGGYLLLKELPDDEARRRVMARLLEISYNTALQRLDRAMLGHSMNYRTPFLDAEVVALCLQLPVQWKIHTAADGTLIEKWLLREAFRDMLPEQIHRREKHRFSGGSGTDHLIESISDEMIPAGEFTESARQTVGGYRLNSPKELHYYRLFKEHFPATGFEQLVGRWDPGK